MISGLSKSVQKIENGKSNDKWRSDVSAEVLKGARALTIRAETTVQKPEKRKGQ